jgi:hypothetical protein
VLAFLVTLIVPHLDGLSLDIIVKNNKRRRRRKGDPEMVGCPRRSSHHRGDAE